MGYELDDPPPLPIDPRRLSLRALVELDNATEDIVELQGFARELLAGKVDRVAIMCKEVIPAHIEACKQQIDTLTTMLDRLKKYSLECLELAQTKEMSGLVYRIRSQNNPPSLKIYQEKLIPEKFWVTKTTETITLDKVAIKQAIESGELVPGVEVEQGQHVRFEPGRAAPKKRDQ